MTENIEIDYAKYGATTILSCGTTNAGHYVNIQQGLDSYDEQPVASKIFNYLSGYAPKMDDGWVLHEIKFSDYKNYGKLHRVEVDFSFRRDRLERYSKLVALNPSDVAPAYEMYNEACCKEAA